MRVRPHGSVCKDGPPVRLSGGSGMLIHSGCFVKGIRRKLGRSRAIVGHDCGAPVIRRYRVRGPVSYTCVRGNEVVIIASARVPRVIQHIVKRTLKVP